MKILNNFNTLGKYSKIQKWTTNTCCSNRATFNFILKSLKKPITVFLDLKCSEYLKAVIFISIL